MTNTIPCLFKIDIPDHLTDALQLAVVGLGPILACRVSVLVCLPSVPNLILRVFEQTKRMVYTPDSAVIPHLIDPDIGWAIRAGCDQFNRCIDIQFTTLPDMVWGTDPLNEWIDAYCGKPNAYREWALSVLSQVYVTGVDWVAPTDASRYYEQQLVTGVVLNRWINARHRL